MKARPNILTIAGFDPSGGAGLLADIKTFENLKTYGLAVCTCLTKQTDEVFESCDWVPKIDVLSQVKFLFKQYNITAVKIGVMENWDVLKDVLDYIQNTVNPPKVVLDPVLFSSTNYAFHNAVGIDGLLEGVDLITPNLNEMDMLFQGMDRTEAIDRVLSKTNLLLKGGHNSTHVGLDKLYLQGREVIEINPMDGDYYEKHGSGCVLSAAIASYLGLGLNLEHACIQAKKYTEKILSSNQTLLAYHKQ